MKFDLYQDDCLEVMKNIPDGKHHGVFELAVNYGFSTPAGNHRMKMHVFEMMYSQCQHWLLMNNLKRY